MPFGRFAKTRIERIVVADPQVRGEGMGRCVRLCRAMCGAQDEGTGNVNGLEWWMVVFDIVGSVSEREGWMWKNGKGMRQTE